MHLFCSSLQKGVGTGAFSPSHSAPNRQGEERVQDSLPVAEDLPTSATIRQQGTSQNVADLLLLMHIYLHLGL